MVSHELRHRVTTDAACILLHLVPGYESALIRLCAILQANFAMRRHE